MDITQECLIFLPLLLVTHSSCITEHQEIPMQTHIFMQYLIQTLKFKEK